MATETKTALAAALERIDEAMDLGAPLRDAADTTLEHAIATNQAGALLRDIGVTALIEAWEQHNRNRRNSALSGRRRVDANLLSSEDALMEALYPIGGSYKRLGALNYGDCLGLSESYGRQAADLARKSRFFKMIAAKLEGGQVVSDVLDEDAVRNLHERAAE